MASETKSVPGRPRDSGLDRAIVSEALQILQESGLSGLSIAAVAKRVGTTRPAVYRRHPDVIGLAVAAIGSLAESVIPEVTGDVLVDLEAELASFSGAITAGNGLSLTSAVLNEATAADVKDAYRRTVVEPRRSRIAAILSRAAADGTITAGPDDQRVLVSVCTGSWYAFAVAGETPPDDWPSRTAALVVKAAGGEAPAPRLR